MTILNKQEIEELRETFETYKPVTGYFEREILLPQVKGRIEYLVSIFRDFQRIATDRRVATHIDEAIRRLADERRLPTNGQEPEVGLRYLAMISQQLETEYIVPLTAILTEHLSNLDELSKDHAKISNVLNIVYNDLQSIVSCRETIFKFHMVDYPNLRNLRTGEVLLGEPFEASLSLMPFDTRLKEVVNVVDTLLGSIREWGKSAQEQRNKNFEIMIKLSEIKSIKESQKYQLILIVVSLVLIVLAFYGNTYLESLQKDKIIDQLQDEISEKQTSVTNFEQEIKSHKTRISELQLKLKELEKQELKK